MIRVETTEDVKNVTTKYYIFDYCWKTIIHPRYN